MADNLKRALGFMGLALTQGFFNLALHAGLYTAVTAVAALAMGLLQPRQIALWYLPAGLWVLALLPFAPLRQRLVLQPLLTTYARYRRSGRFEQQPSRLAAPPPVAGRGSRRLRTALAASAAEGDRPAATAALRAFDRRLAALEALGWLGLALPFAAIGLAFSQALPVAVQMLCLVYALVFAWLPKALVLTPLAYLMLADKVLETQNPK
jgi:hypothetical protein